MRKEGKEQPYLTLKKKKKVCITLNPSGAEYCSITPRTARYSH